MKKTACILIAALSLGLSGCNSEAAETNKTEASVTTSAFSENLSVSEKIELSAAKTENPGPRLKELFDEYYDILDRVSFTYVKDENGSCIYLDSNESYPCWAEVECAYSVSEIEEMLGQVFTGERFEYFRYLLSQNLKEENGHLYMFESDFGSFLYDNYTVFPETFSVKEQEEDFIKGEAEAWDNNYETKLTATIILEENEGTWKLSTVSYLSAPDENADEASFSPLRSSFTAPDGEELTIEDAVCMSFDHAYISLGDSSVVKVSRGDVLDNGLTVSWAFTNVQIEETGYFLSDSEATFDGNIKLTGTLKYDSEGDPVVGETGDIYFTPDGENGTFLPFQLYSDGERGYFLGNIQDEALALKISGLISAENQEARVEAEISRITADASFASSGKRDTATLESVCLLDFDS